METLSTNLQLARLVGVQGTPATIIGDEMIPGAVSWETLEAVVKENWRWPMLSKLRRWLREGAILLVLLAGVIILLDVWRSPQMPAMFDSTPLHTLDGETVTLASISEERPVLLYFWASWCGICRFTTPDVARLQSEGESVMTIALRSGNDGRFPAGYRVKG